MIAAVAEGRTLIHDWVFENRAVYTTELSNLNAKVELLDAHRVFVEGPTNWRAAELVAPQALRPSVVVLIGDIEETQRRIADLEAKISGENR